MFEKLVIFIVFLLGFLLNISNSFYISYFAYGSNLNPDLLERRTLSTEGSLTSSYQRVILADYQLVFNTGIDGLGMAASVEPYENSSTHGLLYKLSILQFSLLLASEGYPIGYKIEEIMVKPYNKGRNISATTLRSGNGIMSRQPSERYIKLLQKGAKEANLEQEYQTYLRSIQPLNSFISRIRR